MQHATLIMLPHAATFPQKAPLQVQCKCNSLCPCIYAQTHVRACERKFPCLSFLGCSAFWIDQESHGQTAQAGEDASRHTMLGQQRDPPRRPEVDQVGWLRAAEGHDYRVRRLEHHGVRVGPEPGLVFGIKVQLVARLQACGEVRAAGNAPVSLGYVLKGTQRALSQGLYDSGRERRHQANTGLSLLKFGIKTSQHVCMRCLHALSSRCAPGVGLTLAHMLIPSLVHPGLPWSKLQGSGNLSTV